MFNIADLMGKVKEMQAKMQEAQDNLVHIKTSAEAGAGMVKATVNGAKQVVSIEIDRDLVKHEDFDMLQDLIVAAVNKALKDIDLKIKDELKNVLPNLNIPGLDELMKQ